MEIFFFSLKHPRNELEVTMKESEKRISELLSQNSPIAQARKSKETMRKKSSLLSCRTDAMVTE